MASVTDIYNAALGKIGAGTVISANDQSPKARACNACYPLIRRAELRKHPWNFAIKRFSLAASASAPAFGMANAFPLPTGWLKLLPPDTTQNFNTRDWIIEGQSVLTNFDAPLQVRCVMDITDTTFFDPLFVEVIACKMAEEMAEQLTQSNTKKEKATNLYKTAVEDAKKANAIEKVPQDAVQDSWLTVRMGGNSLSDWAGS